MVKEENQTKCLILKSFKTVIDFLTDNLGYFAVDNQKRPLQLYYLIIKPNYVSVCKNEIFKQVFDEHGAYLRNFLYYKSGNMQLSEDVAQDAFVKLWENCGKVTREKAKSYLFTIANNLFLNKVGRQKVVLKFQQAKPATNNVDDPHFLLREEEFRKELELAISNLPEKQKVVFLMNRIDKKKYAEIAEHLDISIKAVEKRMHNALKVLRKVHRKI